MLDVLLIALGLSVASVTCFCFLRSMPGFILDEEDIDDEAFVESEEDLQRKQEMWFQAWSESTRYMC
jgi:hypothetical protein